MNYYVFYAIILFCCSISCINYRTKSIVNPFALLTFIFSAFFWGGRTAVVGNDTQVYIRWFEELKSVQVEPLFHYLMVSVKYLTNDPYVFLFIVSLLTLLFIFFAAFNFSSALNINSSLLFSFFMLNTSTLTMLGSGIRQGLAVSICLFSVSIYMKKRHLLLPILMILTSFFIHKSSILALLAFPVLSNRLSDRFFIFAFLLSFCFFHVSWLSAFLNHLSLFSDFKYHWYVLQILDVKESSNSNVQLGIGLLIILASTAFLYYMLRRDEHRSVVFLFSITSIILMVFHEFQEIASRMTIFFTFFEGVAFMLLVSKFNRKYTVSLLMVIYLFLQLLKGILVTNISSGFYTYDNWILG